MGKPCCPVILSDWMNFKEDTVVMGNGAITTDSTLVCAKGGQIKFVSDGQK